jgi:3-methyladenine DNA glycosylase AlkD
LFGVSFANLNALKNKIKIDQKLAEQLWQSGNADARYLATMIADPQSFPESLADAWVKDLNCYSGSDILAGLLAKTSFVKKKAQEWIKSDDEWVGRAGWGLTGYLAMRDDTLPDEYFERLLATIEKTIHQSKNFTKHAMNGALIAIGLRNPKLEKPAVAAAKRIGKVEVDHGETSCKTPDAVAYIQKAKSRMKARR